MRVIVTGGDGYLGWPQAMYLSKRGYEVCVVDNFNRRLWDLECGTDSLIPIFSLQERVAAWRELKKLPDYSKALHVFEAYLQTHYGVSAAPLVEARARAPRSILAHIGLRALRDGDRPRARAAFARAIQVDRYRLKNYLRWVRTFLPHRIAQSLSGGGPRGARSAKVFQE